jgi:hypothetical protein
LINSRIKVNSLIWCAARSISGCLDDKPVKCYTTNIWAKKSNYLKKDHWGLTIFIDWRADKWWGTDRRNNLVIWRSWMDGEWKIDISMFDIPMLNKSLLMTANIQTTTQPWLIYNLNNRLRRNKRIKITISTLVWIEWYVINNLPKLHLLFRLGIVRRSISC